MREGVRLGIDVGDARIGVSSCDPAGLIATPVETVLAGDRALARLRELAEELAPIEIVVGLPRSLSGGEGPAAAKARAFAAVVAGTTRVAVRLVDERMTTVSAESALRAQGRKGRKRRAVVDQVAAVVILQHALDTERSTGRPAGELVEAGEGTTE